MEAISEQCRIRGLSGIQSSQRRMGVRRQFRDGRAKPELGDDGSAGGRAIPFILGHEKPETTQLYAVLSGETRHQAYQRYFV